MAKTDEYYIDKILEHINFINKYMSTTDLAEFQEQEILQDSMMLHLVQISEGAKNLTPEYLERHSEIPWNDIYGLRNRIVHDYGHVDLSIVYETLKEDVPYLKEIIEGTF